MRIKKIDYKTAVTTILQGICLCGNSLKKTKKILDPHGFGGNGLLAVELVCGVCDSHFILIRRPHERVFSITQFWQYKKCVHYPAKRCDFNDLRESRYCPENCIHKFIAVKSVSATQEATP